MNAIKLVLGIVLIIAGFTGWKLKLKWIFCGVRQINVDTKRYVKFMGITAISLGLLYVAIAVFGFLAPYPIPFFIMMVSMFSSIALIIAMTVFAEKKYKQDSEDLHE